MMYTYSIHTIHIQYILVNIQACGNVNMQLLTLDIYDVYRFNTY